MSVKLIFIARRRSDLTAQQFQDYWRGEHATLVRELQDTVRITKYVQSHTLDTPLNEEFTAARGMPSETPPDGVAEVWWDSVEDVLAGFSGPAGEEAARGLIEDEAHFCDMRTSRAFWTGQRHII